MVKLALALTLALAGTAAAQTAPAPVHYTDPNAAMLKKTQEAIAHPEQYVDPAFAEQQKALERAAQAKYAADIKAIFGKTEEATRDAQQANMAANPDRNPARLPAGTLKFRIFITQAMPAQELKELAELSAQRKDMALVIRGLRPGQTLGQLEQWILHVIGPVREGMAVPEIELDPEAFRTLKITMAPVLVRYDDKDAAQLRVGGLANADYLDGEYNNGKRGDLGNLGPMVPVIEADLIEQMKAAAANADWEGMKAHAVERAFKAMKPIELPTVTQSARRIVDPSFVVTEDIVTPDGRVIAAKGLKVNPLERAPFTRRVLMFDPYDPNQVAVALHEIRAYPEDKLKLLVTRLDPNAGFNGYVDLMTKLGRRVYLLTPQLVQTFHIERVPSIVTAAGNRFVVDEIDPVHPSQGPAHASP